MPAWHGEHRTLPKREPSLERRGEQGPSGESSRAHRGRAMQMRTRASSQRIWVPLGKEGGGRVLADKGMARCSGADVGTGDRTLGKKDEWADPESGHVQGGGCTMAIFSDQP